MKKRLHLYEPEDECGLLYPISFMPKGVTVLDKRKAMVWPDDEIDGCYTEFPAEDEHRPGVEAWIILGEESAQEPE